MRARQARLRSTVHYLEGLLIAQLMKECKNVSKDIFEEWMDLLIIQRRAATDDQSINRLF